MRAGVRSSYSKESWSRHIPLFGSFPSLSRAIFRPQPIVGRWCNVYSYSHQIPTLGRLAVSGVTCENLWINLIARAEFSPPLFIQNPDPPAAKFQWTSRSAASCCGVTAWVVVMFTERLEVVAPKSPPIACERSFVQGLVSELGELLPHPSLLANGLTLSWLILQQSDKVSLEVREPTCWLLLRP